MAKLTKHSISTVALALGVLALVVLSGWVMIIVEGASSVPRSDFTSMPSAPLSMQGTGTVLTSVVTVYSGNLATGVQGNLETVSGKPVSGAEIYVTYFYQFAYRTQVTTTDGNGHFEIMFPMNWTGWLPLTVTYFGDGQHQGLKQLFGLQGENL
jgi:hypothetical protein